MKIPPRDVFAAEARRAVEAHDEWDSPHAFTSLHWDGERVTYGMHACIMPDVDPKDYPRVMMETAREEFGKCPDDPAYAYLLQIEAFACTEPGPDATQEEREQYERDRRGHNFRNRADAREVCVAWCADIHGRVWSAGRQRNSEGHIAEAFYGPGRAPSGRLVSGLLAVAAAAGAAGHGLVVPGRVQGWN